MSRACIDRCVRLAKRRNLVVENLEEQTFLERLHCTYVSDYIELLAAVENLKEYLKINTNVNIRAFLSLMIILTIQF